jgi:endonuclease YncB( thermonuclease family)
LKGKKKKLQLAKMNKKEMLLYGGQGIFCIYLFFYADQFFLMETKWIFLSRWHDGDSFEARDGTRPWHGRLWGVDAPEKGQEEASLKKMIGKKHQEPQERKPLGHYRVYYESKKDLYGRWLVILPLKHKDSFQTFKQWCRSEGKHTMNYRMVLTGQAFLYPGIRFPCSLWKWSFLSAERQAKKNARGVWSVKTLQRPWSYRRSIRQKKSGGREKKQKLWSDE